MIGCRYLSDPFPIFGVKSDLEEVGLRHDSCGLGAVSHRATECILEGALLAVSRCDTISRRKAEVRRGQGIK